MTIDKEQLKALALALGPQEWICAVHDDCEYVEGPDGFVAAFDTLEGGRFMAAANPATVLALLDEIDRLEKDGTAMLFEATMKAVAEQRDRLKAECERLRKDAERYRWLRDSEYAGKILRDMGAKYREDADDKIDASMAKEAGHD